MKKYKKNREQREKQLKKYKLLKFQKAQENQIQRMWQAFIKTEESDFKKYMGFGKDEIERIGVKKFFDAIGFKTIDDLSKWRKDRFHLTVCPDCKNAFGIYEMYSVCDDCMKNYNKKAIDRALTANTQSGDLAADFYQMFFLSKTVRDSFRISRHTGKTCIYLRRIIDPDNIDVMLIEDIKEGETVQFVMNDLTIFEENGFTCFVIDKKELNKDAKAWDIKMSPDEDMEARMHEARRQYIHAHIAN